MELGDEVSRDAAALADLDALRFRPDADRLRVVVPGRSGPGPAASAAAAAAGAAGGAAGGGDVRGEGVPQCLGVLVGQVDLVVGPVQAEPDRLALPVRDGFLGNVKTRYRETFDVTAGKLKLGTNWTEYSLYVSNADLSSVMTPFCALFHQEDNPEKAVIYVDDIQYRG